MISELWQTEEPVKPDPYLEEYDWASDLSESLAE
jgi:urea transport system substrate-binding protein